jgi:hypothetical protein
LPLRRRITHLPTACGSSSTRSELECATAAASRSPQKAPTYDGVIVIQVAGGLGAYLSYNHHCVVSFCSPHVAFCGYSIPHPTEHVVNLRVQTTGEGGSEHRWPQRGALRSATSVVVRNSCYAVWCSFCKEMVARGFCCTAQAQQRLEQVQGPFSCLTSPGLLLLLLVSRVYPLSGEVTAAAAVRAACGDLKQVCAHIDGVFDAAVAEFNARPPQPARK